MTRRSRDTEFRRLGAVSGMDLPFSDLRRRRLELEAAWRRAAGPALSDRVLCVGWRGGVLELSAPGEAWAEEVRRLLPQLMGRLRASGRSLEIRRVRVRVDERPIGSPGRIGSTIGSPVTDSEAEASREGASPEERLRRVAQRIASGGRGPSPR